jgi:hypothetical protein
VWEVGPGQVGSTAHSSALRSAVQQLASETSTWHSPSTGSSYQGQHSISCSSDL